MVKTIGQIARELGISVHTIRFYEKIGLLSCPVRTRGGVRSFSDEEKSRLKFIRHAHEVGFELKEIRTLLDLKDHLPTLPPGQVKEHVSTMLRNKRDEVHRKMEKLGSMEQELSTLLASCESLPDCSACPALNDFSTAQNL